MAVAGPLAAAGGGGGAAARDADVESEGAVLCAPAPSSPIEDLPVPVFFHIFRFLQQGTAPEDDASMRLINTFFKGLANSDPFIATKKWRIDASYFYDAPEKYGLLHQALLAPDSGFRLFLSRVTHLKLTGAWTDALRGPLLNACPALTTLDLWGTEMWDRSLEALGSLTSLCSLNLGSSYGITGEGLAHLAPLQGLRSLVLSGITGFEGANLAHLVNLKNLTSIDLEGTQLTNATIAPISSLTNLTALTLSLCEDLTDEGLVHLVPLQGLRSLRLTGKRSMGRDGSVHLSSLKNLTSLNLAGNKALRGPELAHLTLLPALRSLDLGDTRIPNADMVHIGSLPTITALDLSFCEDLTGEGLRHLLPLKDTLQSLNLSFALRLNNPDLAVLGQLEALTALDLSGLHFTVNVQGLHHLTPLTQLTHLNLNFMGKGLRDAIIQDEHLPQIFPSFPKLRWLDLTGAEVSEEGLQFLFQTLPELTFLNFNARTRARGERLLPRPGGAPPLRIAHWACQLIITGGYHRAILQAPQKRA